MSGQSRLAALDERLSIWLRVAERPGLLRDQAILLAHSGDSWFWLLGLALVWWLGGDFWRERAQDLAVGILLTAFLVMIIKLIVRRRRPEGSGARSTAAPTRIPSHPVTPPVRSCWRSWRWGWDPPGLPSCCAPGHRWSCWRASPWACTTSPTWWQAPCSGWRWG